MALSELKSFFIGQQSASEFTKLKAKFALSVNWEGAGFIRTPPEIIDQINEEAADNLMRLKCHLNLFSFPTVGLLTDWNEVLPEESRLMQDVYADAIVDQVFPHGRIRISPSILKAIVTEKTGIAHPPPIPLSGILGHEVFHIWQFLHTPQQVERDVSTHMSMGIEAWTQTKTEIEAREFERHWIEFGQTY